MNFFLDFMVVCCGIKIYNSPNQLVALFTKNSILCLMKYKINWFIVAIVMQTVQLTKSQNVSITNEGIKTDGKGVMLHWLYSQSDYITIRPR